MKLAVLFSLVVVAAATGAARASTCSNSDTACFQTTETGNNAIGVNGVARGTGASYGVLGDSYVNEASSAGVYGSAEFGNGVVGLAERSGQNGVQGTSKSWTASGVYGVNTSGFGYGVAGRVSGDGIAVYGQNTSGNWAGMFDGLLYASTVYNGSDAALKKDVRDLPQGLASLLQLRPVTYTLKENSDGRPQIGLIAQELQKVLPELVAVRKAKGNDILAVNYTGLIPVLVKAVQEQQAVIARQEARLAALEQAQRPLRSSMFDGIPGAGWLAGMLALGAVIARLQRKRAA